MKPPKQVLIHLQSPLHGLLKKAAESDGRSIKGQVEHYVRTSLAQLLASKKP